MNFMPLTTNRHLSLHLKKLRAEAAQKQSTPLLQQALEQSASESQETHDSYAQQSLHTFIRNNEEHNLLPLIAYLLQTPYVTLASASRYITFQSASILLFDLIFQHGWNVNESDEHDNGRRVLDLMMTDESYVQWLLGHGAQVHFMEAEPILDLCARVGLLATVRLLQEKGAVMS